MLKTPTEKKAVWQKPLLSLLLLAGALVGLSRPGALVAGMAVHEGGGFLLAYLLLSLLVGVPLMLAWLHLGRRAENPATAVQEAARANQLGRYWGWLGVFWQLLALLLLAGVVSWVGALGEEVLASDGSLTIHAAVLVAFLALVWVLGVAGPAFLEKTGGVLALLMVLVAVGLLVRLLAGSDGQDVTHLWALAWPAKSGWIAALKLVFIASSLGGAALWTLGNYLPARPVSLLAWTLGAQILQVLLALLVGVTVYLTPGTEGLDPVMLLPLLGVLLAALVLAEAVTVRLVAGGLHRQLAMPLVLLVAGALAMSRQDSLWLALLENWLLPLSMLAVAVFVGWQLKETQVRKSWAITAFPLYLGLRALLRLAVPLAVLALLLLQLDIF